MKLEHYSPTFRNVLLKEVVVTKTKGGIILPSTLVEQQEEKVFKVVKTGKDCIEVKTGDAVRVMRGIQPEKITLLVQPEKDGLLEADFEYQLQKEYDEHFVQVMEQQIIGYFRL